MSITSYITKSFQSNSDIQSSTQTVTSTGLLEIAETVTASGTTTISANLTAADLQIVYLSVDQDSNVTFDGTSNPTLAPMSTTAPLLWSEDSGVDNPIVANVTQIVVVNNSATSPCVVQGRFAFTV